MTTSTELAINTIRTLSMDAVQAANSGHPGTPMALAPVGWALFDKLRKHDPKNPNWFDRDRFVLSCGHASMLQYSLLHLSGYGLTLADIKNFRQWDSLTPGHPEVHHTKGVETTTGPLGQGIGNAVGMAMAERHLAKRFNRPGHTVVDHFVWVIASDGDIMEGVAAEAGSLAGHLKLGKLIVFWDDNEITIDGRTNLSFSEDTVARFASYGWHTATIKDGEDSEAIARVSAEAKADPRPSFIQLKTVIGFPSPGKKDTSSAHGSPLGVDEVAKTKEVLGWPNEAFYVPAEIEGLRAAIVNRGADAFETWETARAAYKSAHPELHAELERAMTGELPANWDVNLPVFETSEKGMATRAASGKILQPLAARIPELIGGSADLAGSNKSYQNDLPEFQEAEATAAPRNIHWGIREHAMASAVNGMALHGGVVPYGATFLVFSDYMKPALRLAALMKLRTRYLFSHDSIGLGEDGPTHQPVEHLAALRAIPGFTVLRPSDANETRECWKAMLDHDGPAALVLTRQAVPTFDRSKVAPAEGARRGAYVLADSTKPEVILVATGSEVSLALMAHEKLVSEGVASRVVSMPSWSLFSAQEASYQDEVLPPSVTARVAIEAGTRFGWERWVGNRGGFVTLDHFGASAPAEVLFERFGFTVDNVVSVARRVMG